MNVTVSPSTREQIAEAARYWRDRAGKETVDRLVRDIQAAVNQLATGMPGNKVEGLTVNFKRVRVSKHPPFYLYYFVDPQLEEVFVFLLRHASQRPLRPGEIGKLAEQAREEIIGEGQE